MHAGVPGAPFGGVGESGYGYYHGAHGFKCFSHTRIIVNPPQWLDSLMSFRYPPFHVKHIPKIAVKNTLGFKRGETMAEQKIRRVGGGLGKVRLFGVGLVLAFVVAVWDARTGGRLGVASRIGGYLGFLAAMFNPDRRL